MQLLNSRALVLLFPCCLLLSACNPFYVMRATYEQTKILMSREKISDLLQEEQLSKEEREKFELVLAARDFSKTLGITPGGAFKKYSKIDGEAVTWVISASKKDRFEFYTWWFPIVGEIPYKGYFDREDAVSAAQSLAEKDYEVWLRGADAFSTLGFFDDPLLSTTFKNAVPQLVNIVFHECLHSTIWIPGYVDFNESLANFVGHRAAMEFFDSLREKCGEAPESTACYEHFSGYKAEVERGWERDKEISQAIKGLYDELEKLYEGDLSRDEKLDARGKIFEARMSPLHAKYPELRILRAINNAEIMQLKLYLKEPEMFERLFVKEGADWKAFFKALSEIKAAADSGADPFEEVRRRI